MDPLLSVENLALGSMMVGGRLQLMYCVVHKNRQSMLLIGHWMGYTVSFIFYLYCLTQVVFTADNCIKTCLFLQHGKKVTASKVIRYIFLSH